MAYTIQFKPSAFGQLEKLLRDVQKRIVARIEMLSDDPFPPGCKKLSGLADTWRIRAGDYRVLYQVHRGVLLILVLGIGHRREVYR